MLDYKDIYARFQGKAATGVYFYQSGISLSIHFYRPKIQRSIQRFAGRQQSPRRPWLHLWSEQNFDGIRDAWLSVESQWLDLADLFTGKVSRKTLQQIEITSNAAEIKISDLDPFIWLGNCRILQRTSSVIDRTDFSVTMPAIGFQQRKNTLSAAASTRIPVVVCTSKIDLSGCGIGHQILSLYKIILQYNVIIDNYI